jgi:hypothetical protein
MRSAGVTAASEAIPAATCTWLGLSVAPLSSIAQCAAVTTHCGSMSTPPQYCAFSASGWLASKSAVA